MIRFWGTKTAITFRFVSTFALLATVPSSRTLWAQVVDSQGVSSTGGPGGGLPTAYFQGSGVESVNPYNLNINVKIPLVKLKAANGGESEIDLNYNSNDYFNGSVVNGRNGPIAQDAVLRELTSVCVPRGIVMTQLGQDTDGDDDPGYSGPDDSDTDPDEGDTCSQDSSGNFVCEGDDDDNNDDSESCDEESWLCEASTPSIDNPSHPLNLLMKKIHQFTNPSKITVLGDIMNTPISNTGLLVGCDGSTFSVAVDPTDPAARFQTDDFSYISGNYYGGVTYPDGYEVDDWLTETDAHGNYFGAPGADHSSTDVDDNLGRTVHIERNTFGHPIWISYFDDDGTLQKIYFSYKPTNFSTWHADGGDACDPVAHPANSGCYSEALDTILFPNGSKYHFEWYLNPNDGSNTAFLKRLDMPSGGYVRYVPHGPAPHIPTGVLPYGNPTSLDRYVSTGDGEETMIDPQEQHYSYGELAGSSPCDYNYCSNRTITYPTGDTEFVEYAPNGAPYHTVVKNSAGTTLKEVSAVYRGTGTGKYFPKPSDVTVKIDGHLLYSKHFEYSFLEPALEVTKDQNGNVIRTVASTYTVGDSPLDQDNWYGSYQRNILNLKSSETITKNGAGAERKTVYHWNDTFMDSITRDPNGHPVTTTMTAAAYFDNVQTVTSPLGHVTTYDYTGAGGFPTSVTDALGHISSTTYSPYSGRVMTQSDPNDIAANRVGVQYHYDCIGAEIWKQVADGGETSTNYSWNCGSVVGPPPSTFTPNDPLVITTSSLLDASRSLSSTKYYDVSGRTTKVVDPAGAVAITGYDDLGRTNLQTNPTFNVPATTNGTSTTQYDALGRVIRQTDQMGNDTWYCYNDLPTAGQSTGPTGLCYIPTVPALPAHSPADATLSPSTPATWTSVQDARGNITRRGYDSMGNLVAVIEANGALTQYEYDVFGNLRTVYQNGVPGVDTPRPPRSFTYDALNRLTSSTNPETGTITYTYDDESNLTSKTDANGVVMHYHYDALNRMDHKWSSDGTVNAQYFFDVPDVNGEANTCENGIGRLCSAVQFGSGVSFDYDAMGRVKHTKRATEADGSVWHTGMQATYNYAGAPVTYTYPSGLSVTNEYDSAGHLNKVYNSTTPGAPYFSNAQYDPAGHLVYADYANGALHEESNFNSRLQPCRMEVLSGAVAGSGTAYIDKQLYYGQTPETNCQTASGNTGNIWSIIDGVTTSHSLGFTYDSLDRLTSTNRSDGQLSETYHIDGFGNMLLQDNLHTMPNYSIDPNTNRLLLNNTDYTYDAAGMLRSTGVYGHTFDYDADGNLQVLDAGKRSDGDDGDWLGSAYGYYATGERSYKTFSVDCYKDYVTLGSQVFEENNLCAPTVSYIYADGSKIARIEDGTLKYTVNDYLGTASAEFSDTGTLLWKGEFAPFGREVTPVSSSTTNYKFTGKERDTESGLDYFGARYYNSNVGRWTIPDWSAKAEPVPYSKMDNPQSLNLYAYVGNNPITQVDVDGHTSGVDQGAASALLAAYVMRIEGGISAAMTLGGTPSGKSLIQQIFVLKPQQNTGAPSATFTSNEAAARWGMVSATVRAAMTGWEWGGAVYQNSNGTYGATNPRTDKDHDSVGTTDFYTDHQHNAKVDWADSIPQGTKHVGDYHAHTENLPMSRADISNARNMLMVHGAEIMYMVQPNRRVWSFNPAKDLKPVLSPRRIY